MLAFLSARLRMWLLLAVGAPILGWLLSKVGDAIETRRGPNRVSRALHAVGGWLRRRSRGPWGARSQRPTADLTGPADPGTPAR